jgi:hypothetical protein
VRVTKARNGITSVGRLLLGATLVGLALPWAGCSAASGPMKHLVPWGGHSQDEALRKRVEADSFPAAKNVGL